VLAHVVPDVEEADVQEVLESHAAELIEEDLEHWTAYREPEDESSDTVVDWAQLTASALKKRLKVVDDSPSFL
jgi:hypothetical protein